jgi:tRNA A-37 threonylcarbamoyl transferase component Bud32
MESGIGEMRTLPGAADAVKGYTLGIGQTFGDYEVLQTLGRGGMGEVYAVRHAATGRRYALKLLTEELAADPASVERFRREARVMSTLQHPHIVRVDDFGETQGRYWLRMELVEALPGKSSLTLAELAGALGGKLPQADLAEILDQVLIGLIHAHGRGVVHRDLKPSNIMVCETDGSVLAKITDFGLARAVGEDWLLSRAQASFARSMSMGDARTEAPTSQDAGCGLVGTYEYMSPEQRRGEAADVRSDLYAIGLIAYRLLTGRQLSLRRPSELDPHVSREWDAFIARAMEEAPADRYASAMEMRKALGPVRGLIRAWGAAHKETTPLAPRDDINWAAAGIPKPRAWTPPFWMRKEIVFGGLAFAVLLVIRVAAIRARGPQPERPAPVANEMAAPVAAAPVTTQPAPADVLPAEPRVRPKPAAPRVASTAPAVRPVAPTPQPEALHAVDRLLTLDGRIYRVDEFQVNGETYGMQRYPAVYALERLQILVVWEGRTRRGIECCGRIFQLDGRPVGDAFVLSAKGARGSAVGPAAALLPGRGIVAAWNVHGKSVHGRIFDRYGKPAGDETVLLSQNAWPVIRATAAGDFVVAGCGGFKTPVARGFNAMGRPYGDEWRLADEDAALVSLDCSVNGRVTCVWCLSKTPRYRTPIRARHFDLRGEPLGAAFDVNSSGDGARGGPTLAYRPTGECVVVWEGYGKPNVNGIYARWLDDRGRPTGTEWRLNEVTAGRQTKAQLGIDARSGEVLVAWECGASSHYDIHARLLDERGRPVGGEFVVNQHTAGSQTVAWNSGGSGVVVVNGTLVFVWSGQTPGDREGIGLTIMKPVRPPGG